MLESLESLKSPCDLLQTRAEPVPVGAEQKRTPPVVGRGPGGPAVGRRALADQHRSETRVRLLDGGTLGGSQAQASILISHAAQMHN